MQRFTKFDGTISDTFVAVCSPAQLEDLPANAPEAGSVYYRTSHIQIVSTALEFLEWAYITVVNEVQMLCSDMDALDSFDEVNTITIDSSTVVQSNVVVPYNLNGSIALANGVDEGTVTGLNLPFVPSQVLLTVMKPEEGYNIFATVIAGSVTTDGFLYELSGETDSTGYTLNYLLVQ